MTRAAQGDSAACAGNRYTRQIGSPDKAGRISINFQGIVAFASTASQDAAVSGLCCAQLLLIYGIWTEN